MNMSKANELLSLTANVGVIASIIFLGVEMQQNTDMMKSQTRNSIVENQLTFYKGVIDNPDFAAVVNDLRLDAELYQPGSTERIQYHFFAMSQFSMWENEWYQYKMGLFDEEEFNSRVNTWKTNIKVSINQNIWKSIRNDFSEDFRVHLNNLI